MSPTRTDGLLVACPPELASEPARRRYADESRSISFRVMSKLPAMPMVSSYVRLSLEYHAMCRWHLTRPHVYGFSCITLYDSFPSRCVPLPLVALHRYWRDRLAVAPVFRPSCACCRERERENMQYCIACRSPPEQRLLPAAGSSCTESPCTATLRLLQELTAVVLP